MGNWKRWANHLHLELLLKVGSKVKTAFERHLQVDPLLTIPKIHDKFLPILSKSMFPCIQLFELLWKQAQLSPLWLTSQKPSWINAANVWNRLCHPLGLFRRLPNQTNHLVVIIMTQDLNIRWSAIIHKILLVFFRKAECYPPSAYLEFNILKIVNILLQLYTNKWIFL